MMSGSLIKVHIDSPYESAVKWTWELFANYSGIDYVYSNEVDQADFCIGANKNCDLLLAPQFWERVFTGNFSFKGLMNKEMLVEIDGSEDLLASCFYFSNCLWERDEDLKKDRWGRCQFENSIWKAYGHNKPFTHVNNIFDDLAKKLNVAQKTQKSSVFLSHDIDAVYSAWQEDGKSALKSLKIISFVKLLFEKVTNKHSWFNFREIVQLEKKYNVKSTFFWLTTREIIPGIGKNADYDVHSEKFIKELDDLEKLGASHGIHKSIASSELKDEVGSFKRNIIANRYHYLRFNFEDLIQELSQSGLKMDASLGYAEVIGFRNGFSLPFSPFNFKTNQKSNFIEVPLTIMDATLSRYQKIGKEEALSQIENFIEENKSNAIISILWHNTHFTNFKYEGYLEVYEGVLNCLKNNQIESISPDLLIRKFLL